MTPDNALDKNWCNSATGRPEQVAPYKSRQWCCLESLNFVIIIIIHPSRSIIHQTGKPPCMENNLSVIRGKSTQTPGKLKPLLTPMPYHLSSPTICSAADHPKIETRCTSPPSTMGRQMELHTSPRSLLSLIIRLLACCAATARDCLQEHAGAP